MIESKIFDAVNKPTELEKDAVVKFLYDNLEEYGDKRTDIRKAVDYAIKEFVSFGGFVLVIEDTDIIKGVVVVNQTGMEGYIPENILVYIATHKGFRGEGLGKKLMQMAIDHAKGDIALHVEPENPAVKLYEKFGFTNPYLEMRLKK
ncbi:MAG: GNAT family N-acetyltransferase [Bacteroidia bacterium]|nr:GNAT family N-acetyltransferase [Bacteroidia bacterium]